MATRMRTRQLYERNETSARCKLAELLILCARIGFNP